METFFNYKGKLIELNKESIKIEKGDTTPEEIGESIRSRIIKWLHYGYYIVFLLGNSKNFDLMKFFSNFEWFPQDFFLNANYKNTKYLRKHNLIKSSEDKDHFGNEGCYEINEKSKFFFLTLCELNEFHTLLENNQNLVLENIYVD